jgi:hypothetical protein
MPSFLDQLEQRLLHTAGDIPRDGGVTDLRDILSILDVDNALRSLHFVKLQS